MRGWSDGKMLSQEKNQRMGNPRLCPCPPTSWGAGSHRPSPGAGQCSPSGRVAAIPGAHKRRPRTSLLIPEDSRLLPWRFKREKELAALVASKHWGRGLHEEGGVAFMQSSRKKSSRKRKLPENKSSTFPRYQSGTHPA